MRHLCKWTTLAEHQWTSNVRQLTSLLRYLAQQPLDQRRVDPDVLPAGDLGQV